MQLGLPVDIVVPIYNAYDDLRTCIASVLRCTPSGNYRLVLVDDASPDPRIGPFLDDLARAHGTAVLVLRNAENLGFSHSVNRGILASEDRDVVLLNTDTEVTGAWLDKLRRCAHSDDRIGTVTPFSNNATICSFPRFGLENDLAELPPIAVVDRAIEECSLPGHPDIPTAIGFCMYIRRKAIDAVGVFDAANFGRGYGEDNDFSIRVWKAGLRNVLCSDTFVAHSGSRSFDEAKRALSRANVQRLGELHPGYADRLRKFISDNPLPAMLAVAAERLKRLAGEDRAGILHVLHGDPGGGTRQHVTALAREGAGLARHYVLFAVGAEWALESASGPRLERSFRFRRRPGESWTSLAGDLIDFLAIDLVHVHHVSGARSALLDVLAGLPVPYGVTLHDHYFVCPTIALLSSEGRYCGAPDDVAVCQRCLASQPLHAKVSIVAWRDESARVLERAAFAIVPSEYLARAFRQYFPSLRVTCIPHGVAVQSLGHDPATSHRPPADGVHVIGVLGAIGPAKGARNLERLVERSKERGLPLRWVLIGYTDRVGERGPWSSPDGCFIVLGPYDRRRVRELAEEHGIELFVFPGVAPETFSFALSESWNAGRPALVPPIGALAERVQGTGAGWLMDDWRSPDAVLDQLVAILTDRRQDYLEKRRVAAAVVRKPIASMIAETHAVYEAALADGLTRRSGAPRVDTLTRFREAALLGQHASTSAPPPPSAVATLPARNAPCPCGSGKRYKHCCGAASAFELAQRGAGQLVAEAMRRHQAGLFNEARGLYERALEADPGLAIARHYLGVVLWQTGDSERAEPLIRASLEVLLPLPEYFSNLGLCLNALGRYDHAIAAFRRAIELDGAYAPAHNNLGLGLQAIGEVEDAIASYRRAIEIMPDFAEARWNLDVVLRQQGES